MPKKIFSNKYDLIFPAIGVLLLILLIGATAYSINFLIQKAKTAFNAGLIKGEEVVTFNLGEVEKIKSALEKR